MKVKQFLKFFENIEPEAEVLVGSEERYFTSFFLIKETCTYIEGVDTKKKIIIHLDYVGDNK